MADETVPIRRTKRCGNCTWFDGESRCYLNPPAPLAVTPVVVRDRANIKKHYERYLQEVAEGPVDTVLLYWPDEENARPWVKDDDYCASWAPQRDEDWEDDPGESSAG